MVARPAAIWKTWLAGPIVVLSLVLACVHGQPARAPASGDALPPIVNLDTAVSWALRYNPEIAVQRQQRGIANAKVLIANAYPASIPYWRIASRVPRGPVSAGITNSVPLEHLILWEMEVRGQGKLRRQSAAAGLSRTDWEIARQEQLLIARVLAAFSTWLYRDEKLRLFKETQSFNNQLAEDVRGLMKAGKLHANDLILAQTEAEAVHGLGRERPRGPAGSAVRRFPRTWRPRRHVSTSGNVRCATLGADVTGLGGDGAAKPGRLVGQTGRGRRG